MNGFIRFPSHRQREKALAVLADAERDMPSDGPYEPPHAYYSLRRDCGTGGVYWINGRQYTILLDAGVMFTVLRKPWDDLMRCL